MSRKGYVVDGLDQPSEQVYGGKSGAVWLIDPRVDTGEVDLVTLGVCFLSN